MACAVLLGPPALAEAARAQTPERAGKSLPQPGRLEQLARLWGQVRFRHPALVQPGVDWDAAFVAAAKQVEVSRSREDYASAVQGMLSVLGDPLTTVALERGRTEAPAGGAHDSGETVWSRKGEALHFVLRATCGLPPGRRKQLTDELKRELGQAHTLVADLRLRPLDAHSCGAAAAWSRTVLDALVPGPMKSPREEEARYSGYPMDVGSGSGAYASGLHVITHDELEGTSASHPEKVALILDEATPLHSAMLRLHEEGRVVLVGEGPVTDGSMARSVRIDLGEGVVARVRVTRSALPIQLDRELPSRAGATGPDAAWAAAQSLLSGEGSVRPARREVPTPPRVPPAEARADTEDAYPSLERRLLAAAKLWTVIDLFYPYQDLLDSAWDKQLPGMLAGFARARDAESYAAEVMKAMSAVQDTHSWVTSRSGRSPLGGLAPLPLDTLRIDGKTVVVGVRGPLRAAGFRVGDVIEAVDGEPLASRVHGLEPFVTASTPASRTQRLTVMAVSARGREPVQVRVSGPEGRRTLDVRPPQGPPATPPVQPPYEKLAGDLGYIDLTRLEPGEVDKAFEALSDTRGLVLDLRGYPRSTFLQVARHLNVRKARTAALIDRPLVTGVTPRERLTIPQEAPESGAHPYLAPTVALIDERTVSQAEHTCLFLEAVADTTFIGSRTAGTDGDVTNVTLPGGLVVHFTGQAVRHADGRRLQRVGIPPHVTVRPTLAGLREGRDEVRERAITWLLEQAPASRKPVKPGGTSLPVH